MAWSEEQLRSIEIAERVTSVFSLLGCSFIITTFCSHAAFRKPINRLIFYASFGNILTSVAMLIARQGVIAGPDSALCQMQAFFIQQWMPADPLWSFCMALNVYLTFYQRYTVVQLRSMEWKYLIGCYGIPLIPNLTMFLIRTKDKGRIYGPAVIWCSITTKWQFLRIACFYGPIWLISFGTLTIFLNVGRDVYKANQNFRQCVSPGSGHSCTASTSIRKVTTYEIQRELAPLAKSPSREPSLPSIAQVVSTATAAHFENGNTEDANTTDALSPSSPGFPNVEPHNNLIARSYLRCSLLFFIAMVVTWLPSSVNRIYSLTHPTTPNYPLNLVAATVLPLQGFWNSIIYLSTSHSICAELFNTHVMAPIRRKRRGVTGPIPFLVVGGHRDRLGSVESASYAKDFLRN